MYKFIYEQPKIYSTVKSVTMEVSDGASVFEMLEAFKEFLNGTGYRITGEIDIIEDNTPKLDDLPDTEEPKCDTKQ